VERHVLKYLEAHVPIFQNGPISYSDDPALSSHCKSIRVCLPTRASSSTVYFWQAKISIYVYRLNSDVGVEELGGSDDSTSDTVVACHQFMLPSVDFEGLWDSLYFDSTVKDDLINYAATAMLFAKRRVDPTLIACNRVVLLYGPPGTGKTTLCKALAQTLSIRLQGLYSASQLVEINSHSLFSKWFSESGKLVQRLFESIEELVADKQTMVFVLIDEVESLASARQGAASSAEPSDAVRSVNALLTQLDKLSRYENVMILATSNITGAIDVAFLDRADMRQYIGPPSLRARYEILRSCVLELARVGIVRAETTIPVSVAKGPASGDDTTPKDEEDSKRIELQQTNYPTLLPFEKLCEELPGIVENLTESGSTSAEHDANNDDSAVAAATRSVPTIVNDLIPEGATSSARVSAKLLAIALAAQGLSGRSLRKLPFQAHAFGLTEGWQDESESGTDELGSDGDENGEKSADMADSHIASNSTQPGGPLDASIITQRHASRDHSDSLSLSVFLNALAKAASTRQTDVSGK